MSQQTTLRRLFSHIGFLQIAIILLVLLTALIHLQQGIADGSGGRMGGGPGGFGGRSGTAVAGTPGAFGTPGALGTPRAMGTPGTGNAQGNGSGQGQGGQGGFGSQGGPGGGGSILRSLPVSLSVLFILNFVGYIVLGVALYLPFLLKIQRIVRWLLIVYTAVTIAAYFLIAGTHGETLGIVDKVIEVALIVLLLVDEWQSIKRKGRGSQEPHPAPQPDYSQPISYSQPRY